MSHSPVASVALAFACALPVMPAHALEPFKAYDSFSNPQVNPALWIETERTRLVRGGQLELIERGWGGTTADSGSVSSFLNEDFIDPSTITAMRAKVTVNALEVPSCGTNPTTSFSRARVLGTFFNRGTPVPGSYDGDVVAQVRVGRFSNSTDAPGVLRVQGTVFYCTGAACDVSTPIGTTVDLGTVNLGTATTVQLQWDKPNKTFLFSRDNGAATGSLTYTDNDSQGPGFPQKDLQVRSDIANCLSGPRVTGYVDALFDNVAVNKSAAP